MVSARDTPKRPQESSATTYGDGFIYVGTELCSQNTQIHILPPPLPLSDQVTTDLADTPQLCGRGRAALLVGRTTYRHKIRPPISGSRRAADAETNKH